MKGRARGSQSNLEMAWAWGGRRGFMVWGVCKLGGVMEGEKLSGPKEEEMAGQKEWEE